MGDNSIRVAAYFEDEAQRQQAEAALEDPHTFANVVEGSAPPEKLDELSANGLVVEVLTPDPITTSTATSEDANEVEAVRYLEEQARTADLGLPDSRWPHQGEVAVDPAQVAPEQVPAEEAYRIRLAGPITRAQRIELYNTYGVDIAAFEPPDRYRTILTREQYAQVRQLPYVLDVTPYRLEDALTKEMVDLIERTRVAQPGLATAGGADEPQVFDVLLHRERDLPHIRDLIDKVPGTTVIGTSNLRIRFRAPSDLPFLGALADRVEVRKIAPFEPPTI